MNVIGDYRQMLEGRIERCRWLEGDQLASAENRDMAAVRRRAFEDALADLEEAVGPRPDEALSERCRDAVRALLEGCGMEVLEEPFACDAGAYAFVAEDMGEVVFVEVRAVGGSLGREVEADREAFEEAAVEWISRNPERDGAYGMRLDVVTVRGAADGRLFARHHKNVLGRAA